MNIKHGLFFSVLVAAVSLALARGLAADLTVSAKPERVGVYDSRVLAYAHFWSEAEQREQNKMFAAAKEAKSKGDTNRLGELKAQMKQRQEKNHLQVFSTAPVDDVLATIKDRVELVQKEAGVSRLLSKWDEAGLKSYRSAERVDVTEQLLGAFKLDAKQLKVVSEIRKNEPLPLAKAKEMLREGKL
jgi:hypothetical protein